MLKPIWCKCKGHSWTRKQLYAAWENGVPVICPAPGCDRTITVDVIEQMLQKIGMVTLQDSDAPPTDNPEG